MSARLVGAHFRARLVAVDAVGALARRARIVAVAALVIGASACVVDHPVTLGLDTRGPISCVDSATDLPLVARALEPAFIDEDVLLVFDFVRTSTFPRCRPTEIVEACASGTCTAIPSARTCLRVPRARLAEIDEADLDELRVSDFVDGQPLLLADAPTETVIVRLTVVLDGGDGSPCDATAPLARFEPRRLLGCGYSCPVALGSVDAVDIDMDAVVGTRPCDENVVRVCAGLGL